MSNQFHFKGHLENLIGPIFRGSICALLFAGALFAPRAVRAQAFTVTDPTDSTSTTPSTYYWTPLTVAGSGGTYMSDPVGDQQTGQGQDDMVGTTTTPGFFIRYGQIGGVDSVAFRFVENIEYANSKGRPNLTGQISVGLDTNNDGALDIVLTAIGKNASNGINYQAPGTGLNDSPSTTSLGNPVSISAFTSSNFDYEAVNSTIYPDWTPLGTGPNAVLTFAVSFASLNSSLNALGKASITTSTLLRFLAFTSTQTNSINQDIYGDTGISKSTTFSTAGGGFSEWTDITGKPVPELPSGILTGGLMGVGLLLGWLQKRGSSKKAAGSVRFEIEGAQVAAK